MNQKNGTKKPADHLPMKNAMWWDVLKGVGVALLAAALYVLVFALAVRLFHVRENALPVVNQGAKVVFLLLGAWMAVRRHPERGWLRGGLTGVLYVLLSFVLFSAIDGDWSIGWSFLSDLVMGAAVGAIGGILIVNLTKRKK